MTITTPGERLSRGYSLLLVLYCVLLFGFPLLGGRYLTMHEAVLPQSAKEMYTTSEWIVPTSAGRPWLERPPLPQWITMACAHLVGRFDEEWVVRLPSILMATLSVLMVAHLATRWYGRSMGMLSGLTLATSLEFTRYAWLAEQDIHLCAIVTATIALFARLEFPNPGTGGAAGGSEVSFFGKRPLAVLLWFLVLGATNLAKGLVFGTAMVAIPVGIYLLWNADLARIRRYAWFWGWLAFAVVASIWPVAAYLRHPDVLPLWSFDLFGRLKGTYTDINEPTWYYAANFPVITAPWVFLAIAGLIMTARKAFTVRYSAERLLWGWALGPMLVFSIPGGKHHHYMLHSVAPWAILSALALVRLRDWSLTWPQYLKTPIAGALFVGAPLAVALGWFGPYIIEGPAWLIPAAIIAITVVSALLAFGVHHRQPAVAAATLFGFLLVIYSVGAATTAHYFDECRHDTEFFQQVRHRVEEEKLPLVVNADLNSMDIFRILFYIGEVARPVHNLTFLRGEDIPSGNVYVLTRGKDRAKLAALGKVREVMQAEQTRREETPGDRFTLFELDLRVDLVRFPSDRRVSPMQAMDREEGPFIGGRLY